MRGEGMRSPGRSPQRRSRSNRSRSRSPDSDDAALAALMETCYPDLPELIDLDDPVGFDLEVGDLHFRSSTGQLDRLTVLLKEKLVTEEFNTAKARLMSAQNIDNLNQVCKFCIPRISPASALVTLAHDRLREFRQIPVRVTYEGEKLNVIEVEASLEYLQLVVSQMLSLPALELMTLDEDDELVKLTSDAQLVAAWGRALAMTKGASEKGASIEVLALRTAPERDRRGRVYDDLGSRLPAGFRFGGHETTCSYTHPFRSCPH